MSGSRTASRLPGQVMPLHWPENMVRLLPGVCAGAAANSDARKSLWRARTASAASLVRTFSFCECESVSENFGVNRRRRSIVIVVLGQSTPGDWVTLKRTGRDRTSGQ